jgi:hypothetical protein
MFEGNSTNANLIKEVKMAEKFFKPKPLQDHSDKIPQ